MNKNVIIVGPPRSGTSLTAGIFARRRYHVGGAARKAVTAGDDYNPFGYFEADDVIERNVRLFERVGYGGHNTWLFDPISDRQVAALQRLVPDDADRAFLSAYEAHRPWLWKDPRLCFTLDYWAGVVDVRRTVVVLVTRKPQDVYLSFRRKGWTGPGRAARRRVVARIQQHVDAARDALERFPGDTLSLRYQDYAERPADVAERLSRLVGLELSAADLNFRPDLDHSSLGGRTAGVVRNLLRRLPRGPVRAVEAAVPRRLTAWAFPERKYVRSR